MLPPAAPRRFLSHAAVALLTLLGLAVPVRAQDRTFVLVFGSQSVPKLPRYVHTWATVVRATGPTCDPCAAELYVDTISWMPATLKVRPWALCAEPGVNLDLDATIQLMLSQGQRVSVWGPYEVRQEQYERFLGEKAKLESGAEQYKAIDPVFGRRSRSASDCIHALTDLDESRGRLFYQELRRNGESASHFIVHRLHVRGRIVNPCSRHDGLLERLGLGQYPIVYRQYNGSRFYLP